MLRLPQRIDVRLVNGAGRDLPEADVLLAINLLSRGRYYYGNLIGLTDRLGTASLDGDELERRYLNDRRAFPSDYKLELIECDDTIELVLLSEAEVAAAAEAVAGQEGIEFGIRLSYERARNAEFAPAMLRVLGDSSSGAALQAALVTERID